MTTYLLYVGTYTETGSQGIYAYRFHPESGRMDPLGAVADTVNPSFLTLDERRNTAYAVVETKSYKGQQGGAVRAYRIDRRTGKLQLLNEVRSLGSGPCYLSLDGSGNYILLANYHSGSVATFPVLADGRLGEASAFVQHQSDAATELPRRTPKAHAFRTSPDNRFALAADLGLDMLFVYDFEPSRGAIAPKNSVQVQGGAGPRHFVFHPSTAFVYLVNELASQVVVFTFDPLTGALSQQQCISSLPDSFNGQSTAAELRIDSLGRHLYVSNRGHDSIAVFGVSPADGKLVLVQHISSGGTVPRGFTIDPTGRFLIVANEGSGAVVVFRIDASSGRLEQTEPTYAVPSPTYAVFIASEEG